MMHPRPIPRFLMTAEECAAALGIGRTSFAALVRAGKIARPVYPLAELPGGRVDPTKGDPRWPPSDLETFRDRLIAERRQVDELVSEIEKGEPAPYADRRGRGRCIVASR